MIKISTTPPNHAGMPTPSESLRFYAKTYARYIVPTWIFPIYFMAFGLFCQHFKVHAIGLWFWLLIAPIFFGTFLWSRVPTIPSRKRVFLTMVVPFLIFACLGILLAIIAIVTGVSSV
jgi:hypothetical protein